MIRFTNIFNLLFSKLWYNFHELIAFLSDNMTVLRYTLRKLKLFTCLSYTFHNAAPCASHY